MRSFWFGFVYLTAMALLAVLGYGLYYAYHQNSDLLWIILATIYIVALLPALWLVSANRSSASKISWLIVMTAIPFLGTVIFFIFGQQYRHRQKSHHYFASVTDKGEVISNNQEADPELKRQSLLARRTLYHDTQIDLRPAFTDVFAQLFSDITSAKHSVYLSYYIIKRGLIYEELKHLLITKANAGLDVRLIVDDFGSWTIPASEFEFLRQNGVKVAIFAKVNFPFVGSANGYRTHRKFVVIDANIVHVGGANISDEYAHLSSKYGLWIDLGVRMRGNIVQTLLNIFVDDWKLITHEQLALHWAPDSQATKASAPANDAVVVDDSPRNEMLVMESSFISLIYNARSEIVIVTPYFVPTSKLISALITAALTGVKITIYFPGFFDKHPVAIGTKFYVDELRRYGIKFMQLNDMFIHSKFALFDAKYVSFGTANFDFRSLYAQFEVNVVASGPITNDFQTAIRTYNDYSHEVTRDFFPGKARRRLIKIYLSIFTPIL